jgi:hypothetical protein
MTCPICGKPRPHPPTWVDVLEHWDCTSEMNERAASHKLMIFSPEQAEAYEKLLKESQ